MNSFNEPIANELKQYRIEFIRYIDISGLTQKQNRGFPAGLDWQKQSIDK
jgi:hypothetical protein